MLLQQTSGIASHDSESDDGSSPYVDAVRADPAHHWSALEQISFTVEHFGPTHPPGGSMRYTDTGYVILGQLLEHVTTRPLASLVRDECRFDDLEREYVVGTTRTLAVTDTTARSRADRNRRVGVGRLFHRPAWRRRAGL